MAKKLKIFSELGLAVLTVLSFNLAIKFNPAYACGDGDELTNCTEVAPAETTENILIAPGPDADTYSDAGETITSERSLTHSFFLAGNDVTSKDRVDGIAFVAGNLVEVAGSTEYAAVAGSAVKISGSVERDLFAAGNSVTLDDGAYIGRDLYAAGNIVTINTNLYGNAFLGGNRIVLEDITVAGDLNLAAEEIVFKGKVAVSGTVNYPENATVVGLDNLSSAAVTTYAPTDVATVSFETTFADAVIALLGRLLLTIVLIAIAPKFAKKLLDSFRWATSWKHLGLGLAAVVLVPFCAIFVMITLIGLPLGLAALALWLAFLYLATSVTGGVVGNELAKLMKKPKLHIMAKYALGTTLIALLGLIPIVGGLVTALSLCFGFGYLSMRLFRK